MAGSQQERSSPSVHDRAPCGSPQGRQRRSRCRRACTRGTLQPGGRAGGVPRAVRMVCEETLGPSSHSSPAQARPAPRAGHEQGQACNGRRGAARRKRGCTHCRRSSPGSSCLQGGEGAWGRQFENMGQGAVRPKGGEHFSAVRSQPRYHAPGAQSAGLLTRPDGGERSYMHGLAGHPPEAPESVPVTRTHLPQEPSNWAAFMAPARESGRGQGWVW